MAWHDSRVCACVVYLLAELFGHGGALRDHLGAGSRQLMYYIVTQ